MGCCKFQYGLGRCCGFFEKSHVTRIFEPGDLRLRMRSCQGFGDVGGYVSVVAAEEEELRHGRFPQQLVAILAQEHAFQQGDDTRVFSKEDLVG